MEEKRIMQEIWKKLLNLSDLPKTDESFFDLGGNSFIANEASLAFKDKTGKEIEIADFFEKDTIDTLFEQDSKR